MINGEELPLVRLGPASRLGWLRNFGLDEELWARRSSLVLLVLALTTIWRNEARCFI